MLKASIVVPTWRRPRELYSCIEGIERLEDGHLCQEVIVVRRRDDHESAQVIGHFGSLVCEEVVQQPGQIASLAAGARRAKGDIVAFLDDDAIPRPDWLKALLIHYSSSGVGAVGGRDIVHGFHSGGMSPLSSVGKITPWGRLVGNHHLGTGGPRLVQHLKGVNMSVRRKLLAFPENLRGGGAEVHNDLAISLSVHRRGWRVIYDSRAIVDHYPSTRYDQDGRIKKSASSVQNASFNLTYVLASLSPELRLPLLCYGLCVGNRGAPGILRALVALASGDWVTFIRLGPSMTGHLCGFIEALKGPLTMRAISSGD